MNEGESVGESDDDDKDDEETKPHPSMGQS